MKALTLGVTGHRFLAEVEKINAGVEQAVDRILAAWPGHTFRVLSSLAEGSDRLLASRLLQLPGAHLWVPLPLPEQEYLEDFASPSSRREFKQLLGKAGRIIPMPPCREREQGYLAAGVYVLEHSDVLLAVWDGKPAQGVAGTAWIVAQARARSLPLAWIHAGNRLPGSDNPTTLGKGQGRLTCENFPKNGRNA